MMKIMVVVDDFKPGKVFDDDNVVKDDDGDKDNDDDSKPGEVFVDDNVFEKDDGDEEDDDDNESKP